MATKSLKIMAAQGDGSVKKDDAFKVDPRILVEAPDFNPRNYDDPDVVAQIESFAQSYARGQYVPPLLVRVNDASQVEIVDGHQRRRGALLAIERGFEVPYVQVARFYGNDTDRLAVLLRSDDGLKLKPMEVALVYLRFLRQGLSPAEIAERVGRSKARVDQLLLLAQANADVQALVRQGTVSAEAAIDAIRAHGDSAGTQLAHRARELQKTSPSRPTSKTARVTQKHVRPEAIPPKIVRAVVGLFREAAPAIEEHAARIRQIVEESGPIALEGMKVEIDAKAFHALAEAQKSLFDKVMPAPLRAAPARKTSSVPAKFRHPRTGETWTGRGRRPRWVEVALQEGKTMDDLAVPAHGRSA
jgi:DNA-binding protein H-NS